MLGDSRSRRPVAEEMPGWLVDQLLTSLPLCPIELELHTELREGDFVIDSGRLEKL